MPKLEASHLAATYDRLVTAAIHIVDTDGIRLERLLEMRRREASGGSHDYVNFRRAYLKRIALFIERLGAADQRPADVREIHRQYRQEMESDLRELKRELQIAAGDVLVSKEMGVAVLAAAGSAITPIAGVLGVGALVQTGRKYRQARQRWAPIRCHGSTWLAEEVWSVDDLTRRASDDAGQRERRAIHPCSCASVVVRPPASADCGRNGVAAQNDAQSCLRDD